MPIRVLLSDDEALARERLRRMLEDESDLQIVAECGDGKSAIALIKQEKPDLVFLDVQMPEVDGFGVIAALHGEQVPLTIFVTAYDKYAMKAFEVHALDYLLKPVGKDRLSEALGHARKQLSHPSEATFQRKLLDLLADLESRQQTPQRIVIKADGEIVRQLCLPARGRQHPHSAGNDHLAGIAIGTPAIPARAPFHAGECGPHQDLAALAVWRLFHPAARRYQADAEPRLPGECAEAAGDGVGRRGAPSFRGVPHPFASFAKGWEKTPGSLVYLPLCGF
jgi:CheY-like chemotaxis protein